MMNVEDRVKKLEAATAYTARRLEKIDPSAIHHELSDVKHAQGLLLELIQALTKRVQALEGKRSGTTKRT